MKKLLGAVWHFVWEDNSILSWIVNVVLAFVLIKFLVYPGLGFVFDTESPVVAVVSRSMEHEGDFDTWFKAKEAQYGSLNITRQQFLAFPMPNGFSKGDLMLLRGSSPEKLKVGDIIVFKGGEKDPVIHRIVTKTKLGEQHIFATMGDNNNNQLTYEKNITEERIVGKAILKVPFLGYVKIAFTFLVDQIGARL